MARRQVIVQFDDKMLAQLDREARRAKQSRSEVIRRAVGAWFEARKTARLEREYVESYRQFPEEPVISEALIRLAAEGMPPYEA
jgi:metal-responsive CopG/Arc/MetJ family transcriptional regulator